MAFVVDASAFVRATTADDAVAVRLRHRLERETVHAPHLLDAEVGNVLRRLAARGDTSADHARIALDALPALVDVRYEHTGALADAAWRLRHTITFYDALYAALAAGLGVPLVTQDRRLASASGLPCEVELVGR